MSVRAFPTPSLEALWASGCSALPTTDFGGREFASFSWLPFEVPLGDEFWLWESGEAALLMMADRAILECWAIPAAA